MSLNHIPKRKQVTREIEEGRESEAALELLTTGELKMMQSILLSQIQQADGDMELSLLGGVWYRLEGERRRRKSEVLELERLYFAS